MTEEKRIISNGEVILAQDENGVLAFTDENVDKKMYEAKVTFDELLGLVDDAITGIDNYDDSNLMLIQMITKFDIMDTEKLTRIIWDKYGKLVPEQRWYVKVPRLNDVYYCICRPEYGEKTLRTCDPYIVDTYPIDVYEVSFTEAEIKKYRLDKYEKVPVDDK